MFYIYKKKIIKILQNKYNVDTFFFNSDLILKIRNDFVTSDNLQNVNELTFEC